MEKQPVIAICVPVGHGVLYHRTVESLMRARIPRPHHLLTVADRPVEPARNEIVGRLLTDPTLADVTHLLWVDDDMVFAPDAVERLLAHDKPIVGGLCHGRRGPAYSPILLKKDPVSGYYRYWYDFPRGLLEVDATGAAFILVKREVYEAIEEKFPKPGEGPYTNTGNGEDVALCERAKQCGFATYVDTTLEIGHIAEVVVDSTFAVKNRLIEPDAWAPPAPPDAPAEVSVVIPTWNQRPDWLFAAIRSALDQTIPTEVIVVDNGSEPPVLSLPKLPEHPRLRYLRIEKNAGHPWDAVNLGLQAMTTQWFAWLSSDDLWHPQKLARQIPAMKAIGARAGYHAYDTVAEWAGNQRGLTPAPVFGTWREQHDALTRGCVVNALTMVVHKSVVDHVGFFDGANFRVAADWDFMIRVSQATKALFHVLPQTLATRRIGRNDTTAILADPERLAGWKSEIRAIYAREGITDREVPL